MRAQLLFATALVLAAPTARAAVSLWVDDTSGNIGLVNLSTGNVTQLNNTGEDLTDIAFVGSQMFGTTFRNLFKINDATGASTQVGATYSDTGMNALLGSGSTLLSASNATKNIYSVNTTTAALSVAHTSPETSAGDLAIDHGTLFESGVNSSGSNDLINSTTGTVVGTFHTSTQSSFNNVFGIADNGTTMFAVAGTEVFSVNLSNALLTPVVDYAGHGLGAANGTAFIAENGPPSTIPEPRTWVMMGLGFGFMAWLGAQKARKARLA